MDLAEQQRNRLLRRADWRFLLPDIYPAKSFCLAGGQLAEAVALISEQIIQGDQARAESCDLAVLANPTSQSLRQAWEVLQPGGSLYAEWDFPWAGSTRNVRCRLEAVGFAQAACYWPWPLPGRGLPSFWLPVDHPQAIRYFWNNRPRPASFRKRAGRRAGWWLWRLLRFMGMQTPVCATARKPIDNHGAQESRELEGWSRQGLPHQDWSGWDRGHITWLMLTGGSSRLNKVGCLAFIEEDPLPGFIVKMPRESESIPALAHEAETIQRVHALKEGGMPGVPELLFCHREEDFLAVGETVLSGEPIWSLLNPGNYREIALKVTDWLTGLAGDPPLQRNQTWRESIAGPALTAFERGYGPVLEPVAVERTRAQLDSLGDLPLVCEQRDCSPWNLMIDRQGNLAVLDWESAEPNGLPALDLIYFLTHLAFILEGALESSHPAEADRADADRADAVRPYREAYRRMQDPSTFTGRVQAECFRRYTDCLGLNPDALRPLRLLAWLIHSRSEYGRLAAENGNLPAPERLQECLFYQLWKEELRACS